MGSQRVSYLFCLERGRQPGMLNFGLPFYSLWLVLSIWFPPVVNCPLGLCMMLPHSVLCGSMWKDLIRYRLW